MPEQSNIPPDEGRKGGAAATPASSVRVYDQPERKAANPLARIIPIILVLAVLGYLLSRAMRRPEPEPVRQPSVQQPVERNAPSDERTLPGPRGGGGDARGTANPPGPAGSNSGGR